MEIKNDMKMEYKFKKILRDYYFHPSRNYVFKSSKIKFTARCAMYVLWNKNNVSFAGKEFSNAKIRNLNLNKMMIERFDTAIELFEILNRDDSVEILSYLFFVVILSRGRLMELLAEYDIYSWSLFNYKTAVEKNKEDAYAELERSIIVKITNDIIVGVRGKMLRL